MGDVAQSRGLLEAVNLLLTRLAADHAQKEVAKPQETNLEQAKAAGIAMCVATSTPAELVKSALAGAGLDAYMEFVTTTGEAGRSKQFPDVYELALRRLDERHGQKFERAWVFEDAAVSYTHLTLPTKLEV